MPARRFDSRRQLSEAEEDEILGNTSIDVQFETRTDMSPPTNSRILVVPADGTLKAGIANLEMPASDLSG